MRDFGFKIVSEANIFDIEPGAALRTTVDLAKGETRASGQSDWIRDVVSIALDERVPFPVRRSFAFAHGGMCYAYWYQPLLTSVAHDLLRVADFATVEACRERKMKQRTMSRRIAALISTGAIAHTDEPAWRAIRQARNLVSHPTSQTIYGFAGAYALLRDVRDLISRIEWQVTRSE